LAITDCERGELQAMAQAHSTPRQWALRARIVLLAAEGVANPVGADGLPNQDGAILALRALDSVSC